MRKYSAIVKKGVALRLYMYFSVILSDSEGSFNMHDFDFKRFFTSFRMTTTLKFCKNFIILLSLLLIISSCSIKGYKPITESEKSKISEPYIFADNFEKALYSTSIEIYGNNITGLTLIKKTDSAYRVVSMSELGIKYFDLEFPFDEQIPTIVHYVMESINKKLLINLIISDFNLLFFPPVIDKSEILIGNNDSLAMVTNHNKLNYFFNSYGVISKITKRQASKPTVSLSGYTQYYPSTINTNHGNIKFEFECVK